MEGDYSDILGHPTLPVSRNQEPSLFSFSFTKSAFLLATFLGLYVLGVRIWAHVLLWRERSYKLCVFLCSMGPPVVRRVLTRHFLFYLLGRREDGTVFRTATVDLSTSPTLPLFSLVKRTRPDGLNPNQCSSRPRSPIKAARCLNKTLDTEQARVSLTIIPSLNDFI